VNNGPLRHFSQEQLESIKKEKHNFESLLGIALAVLDAMPRNVTMVCGPITSGGLGSVGKNLEHFARVIAALDARGENVFTQLPFEAPMKRVKDTDGYYMGDNHLLEAFYLPLFRSGYVIRLSFIWGWASSYGTRWEHDRGTELGLDLRYLKERIEFLQPGESPFI